MPTLTRSRRRPRVGWVISDQLERSMLVRNGYLCSGGVGLVRYEIGRAHV